MTDSDQSAASRSGGININVSGGMVSVTGDLIGQDSQRGTQDRMPTAPPIGAPPSGTIDRTGLYETQSAQEGIVGIRQELLAELRDSQSALECYVTGYIESYPEVGLVKQVRSLLEEEMYKSDTTASYPLPFWRGLRDRLEDVKPLSTRLKSLLQYDELRPHLEAFDAHLITAREQVQRVLRSYKGIDLNGSAFELDQTIASMLDSISRITEVCRTNTDSMLTSLKSTIDRIFEKIKEVERKQRAEVQRQPEAWGKAAPEGLSTARSGAALPTSDVSTRSRG